MRNMMMYDELQQEEFELIKTERHCPPINVLKKGGEMVNYHLDNCNQCKQLKKEQEILEKINEEGNLLFEYLRKATSIEIGSICSIDPSEEFAADFDDEGVFYNPPKVIVLNNTDKNGLVKVAQLFIGKSLTWFGDIYLHDYFDHYAEAWNVYGMRVDWLKATGEIVDKSIAERILEESIQESILPPKRSLLWEFREDEIKTGSFFSYPAVYSSIMNRLDDKDKILEDQSEIQNTIERNYENEFDYVIEESKPVLIPAGIRTPNAASSKQKIRYDSSVSINEVESTLKIDNREFTVILIQNQSQKTIIFRISNKVNNDKYKCLFVGYENDLYRQELKNRYHSFKKEIYDENNNWLTSYEVIIPRQSAIRVAIIEDNLIDITSDSIEIAYSFLTQKRIIK